MEFLPVVTFFVGILAGYTIKKVRHTTICYTCEELFPRVVMLLDSIIKDDITNQFNSLAIKNRAKSILDKLDHSGY